MQNWLDYVAFDESPTNRHICEKAITRVYGDNSSRYFNLRNDLLRNRNDGTMDVVVICNVLHEISPNKWLSIFTKGSIIDRLLSNNGYLLIIEDNAIPVGEKPNEDGYFVLGGTELKDLFCMHPDSFTSSSVNNEGRLCAHLIPKEFLPNITEDSIKIALDTLEKNCYDNIRRLRMSSANYKTGRLLAFWTQQLANIVIYKSGI